MKYFQTVSLGRGTKAFEVVSAHHHRHAAELLAKRWDGVKADGQDIEVFYAVYVQEVTPPEPGDSVVADPGVWPSIGLVYRYIIHGGRCKFAGSREAIDLGERPPKHPPVIDNDTGDPVG